MRNFGFSLMAFGDVFMGYNPATTGHWLVHDRYLSPVRSSDDPVHDFSRFQLCQEISAILIRIEFQMSRRYAVPKKFKQ